MTPRELTDKVVDILARRLDVPPDELLMFTTFDVDLGAEELDQAEIVLELEDVFKITIPDDSEGKVKTVGDCVKHIGRLAHCPGIEEFARQLEQEQRVNFEELQKTRMAKWQQEYDSAGFVGKCMLLLRKPKARKLVSQ